MKFRQKTYLAVVSALLLSLLALPAFAQSPDLVTAEVDRNFLSTGEYLTLRVIINQAFGGISEPTLPPLDGFDLIGTSTSTNLSIINGVQSTEKVFIYTLHPTAVGDLMIGPVIVNINGQDHYTRPISVNVSQGTGQPPSQPTNPSSPGFPSTPGFPSIAGLLKQFGFDVPPAADINVEQMDPALLPPELVNNEYYVEAEVDNSSPYLGEQVTYTFRYYRPIESVGTQSYQSPDFSGFWVHSEPVENHYGSQLAGRNIRMTEIKHILLPTVNGEVEIEPAQITNEGDMFNRGFTIQVHPEMVAVQTLPAGAPVYFSGAVGDFSIMAEVDTTQTKINEAVTLNITIIGAGNLETFANPDWEIGPEWRAFDSQAVTNIQLQEGMIVGERVISQVLVPTKAGDFTIPAIQFTYFDPKSETYQTTTTQPIGINITPDGSVTAPVTIENNPNTGGPLGELRPIKDTFKTNSQLADLTQNARLLAVVDSAFVPAYWSIWLEQEERKLDEES